MEAITRKQKVLMGILGVGLAALGVDQLMPGPSESEGSQPAADQTASVAQASPAAVQRKPGMEEVVGTLAERMESLPVVIDTECAAVENAFVVPESWRPPEEPQPLVEEDDTGQDTEAFLAQHRLVAVILHGATPGASIDGTFHRIGDEIDGYALVELHDRSVILESDQGRVELSLQSRSIENSDR